VIGSETMLVTRNDLPAPLIHLLFDAAHEIHSSRGLFETQREFPNADPLYIAVSEEAHRHHLFGPSSLDRYLAIRAATPVERLIVVVLPLAVVAVPLVNLLPQLMR